MVAEHSCKVLAAYLPEQDHEDTCNIETKFQMIQHLHRHAAQAQHHSSTVTDADWGASVRHANTYADWHARTPPYYYWWRCEVAVQLCPVCCQAPLLAFVGCMLTACCYSASVISMCLPQSAFQHPPEGMIGPLQPKVPGIQHPGLSPQGSDTQCCEHSVDT